MSGLRPVSQTPHAWQLLVSRGLELKTEGHLWSGRAWEHWNLMCCRFGSAPRGSSWNRMVEKGTGATSQAAQVVLAALLTRLLTLSELFCHLLPRELK